MARGALSALEHSILGLLEQLGTATPYAVRRVFQQSPSSHWSGSSGAIYPAMRRLERARYVESIPRPDDRRGAVAYQLAARGRHALGEWLDSPISDAEAGYSFDPIRLRVLFMQLLPVARQRDLVARALAGLRNLVEREQAFGTEMAACDAKGAVRANRGAMLVLEARIRWLSEIHAELEEKDPPANPSGSNP